MFTHLHTHSHYSLLDGLPKIDDLINRAKELQMKSLAITDHGVLYGAIEFYQKAIKAGIKPIIGMEAYIAVDKMESKRPKIDDVRYHLVLLARDITGYKNLIMLTTKAHLEGYYYKPRVDKELLKKHNEGLIALSGCLNGEVARAALNFGKEKAKNIALEYQKIFGEGNFYLELQDHKEVIETEKVNNILIEVSKEANIPLVATKDLHYISLEDREAQDALICVQTGKTIDTVKRLNMSHLDASMVSEEEMRESFKHIPEAINNTEVIASACNLELELGKWIFPHFKLPEAKAANEYLKEVAYERLKEKIPFLTLETKERLDYELDIIAKKGYSPYFLVIADVANWARSNGIIATTRGSAAGSLVSYAIGITTVNPLEFKLPFERFLNPERPLPPDIDMDFEDLRRNEVIEYVKQKYGEDKVAQIGTFGTMMARAAIRDVGRVLGYPYSLCDRVAKMVPFGKYGFHMTLDNALRISEELRELYNTDHQIKRLLDLAKKVEGCVRHVSVHAAGVVISPTPLTDYIPLQKEPQGGNIITQYDMHAVEASGLLKMDILGIRNLSILGQSVKIVKKIRGLEIDLPKLPLDDKKTYALLSLGETMGVFQLSSAGMTRYLRDLKPSSIFDIMAMVALYRPGPMESIPEYIRRKHNPSQITYLDPRLKDILNMSYGIITFQDDVLLIAIKLAGYTWEEADKLRKAMGKKIVAEMGAQKAKFIAGCIKNRMAEGKAVELWHLIEPFAAYGFNKSHAASYAMVSYQTAYMKAHFPTEFMAALMTAESADLEKVSEAVTECERLKIQVLPPDINESYATFTVVTTSTLPTIRFGLKAIKNVGAHIIEVVIFERKKNGPYQSLEDLLRRIQDKDLNKKSLESLIKCGALDKFGERNLLLHNIDKLLNYSKKAQKETITSQVNLFGEVVSLNSLLRDPLKEASKSEKLSWEKELLGLYISEHPLKELESYIKSTAIPISAIKELLPQSRVTIAGIITNVKKILTRRNEQMAFIIIEDMALSTEVTVFPRVLQSCLDLVEENKLVIIEGRIDSREERKSQVVAEKITDLTQESARRGQAPGDRSMIRLPDNSQIQVNNQLVDLSPGAWPLNLQIALPDGASRELLLRLKSVLASHPGQYRVYLILNHGKTRIIKTNMKVDYNAALISEIEQLLGERSVIRRE